MANETWKEFDQNPLSHSAAHHLVAILDLLDEFGYARVSDVASMLSITRGSASITLDRLVKRGLVTKDRNKFLGLSDEGNQIARSVQAKKFVMKKLFIDLLGVPAEQADIDTCKIEHLISGETAERAARLLQFLAASGDTQSFLDALERFDSGDGLFEYFTAHKSERSE